MAFDYNKIGFKNAVIDKLIDTTSTDSPKFKKYFNLPSVPLKEEEFKTFVDTTSKENYDKIPFMFRLGDTTRPKSVRIKEFKERFNINKKKQ